MKNEGSFVAMALFHMSHFQWPITIKRYKGHFEESE